jgi:hypothetical protein
MKSWAARNYAVNPLRAPIRVIDRVRQHREPIAGESDGVEGDSRENGFGSWPVSSGSPDGHREFTHCRAW